MAQHAQRAVFIHRIAPHIAGARTRGLHIAELRWRGSARRGPAGYYQKIAPPMPVPMVRTRKLLMSAVLPASARPAARSWHHSQWPRAGEPAAQPALDGEVIEFTDGAAHFDKAGVRVNVAGRADCHPFTRRVSGDPRQHRLQDLVAVAVDDVLLSFPAACLRASLPHF